MWYPSLIVVLLGTVMNQRIRVSDTGCKYGIEPDRSMSITVLLSDSFGRIFYQALWAIVSGEDSCILYVVSDIQCHIIKL